MSDLISRQDAIDAVFELSDKLANEMLFIDTIVDEIENLPSIEPERKKGMWVVHDYAFGRERYECTECRGRCDLEYNFCPHCGAEMINKDSYMKLKGADHE